MCSSDLSAHHLRGHAPHATTGPRDGSDGRVRGFRRSVGALSHHAAFPFAEGGSRPPRYHGRVPARALLVVLAATTAVYGRTVNFDLLSWDDRLHLVDNPWLFPPTLAGLKHLWLNPYFGEYVPAAYTAFFVETLVAVRFADPAAGVPAAPWVYHLGSLLLHLACTAMVYRLLARFVGWGRSAEIGRAHV